jgi:hypothetical protein
MGVSAQYKEKEEMRRGKEATQKSFNRQEW